jgi:hypothetical protein
MMRKKAGGGMHPVVSAEELQATVARMQARLLVLDAPHLQTAIAAYRALAPRFERDLAASSRDVALAKASALMLLQALAQEVPR